MSIPTGVKISALPPADAATIDDQLEVNQGGTSKRITLEQTLGLFGGLVGVGTVSNVSVVTANGLAGSVLNQSTTPAITLSTTVSGLLKGNGTAISAATAGTDYVSPTGLSEAIDDRVAALLVAGSDVTLTYDDTANTLTIASTAAGGGSGTVTSVSVASANGLAGTVADATTTPAITLSTTISGLLKGDATAISAAVAGTDYLTPAGAGAAYAPLSHVHTASQITDFAETVDDRVAALLVAGTNISLNYNDVANTLTVNTSATTNTGTVTTLSVVSANGFAGTVATAGTTPAITMQTSITGMLKGNGTALQLATAGTDYVSPTGLTTALTGYLPLTGGTLSGDLTVDNPATTANVIVGKEGYISMIAETGSTSIDFQTLGAAANRKNWLLGSSNTTEAMELRAFDDAFAVTLHQWTFARDGSTTLPAGVLSGTTATFTGLVTALSATAIGAAATTQAFVKASSTANFGIYYGNNVPSFTAAKNSLYINTGSSSTTTRLYINTTGSNVWANFTASA